MESEKKRSQWGSKIGFILAAAGSAVGLGNIWKFPGKAFEGGGGLFLLIYVAIVFLIGMPVMMCEISVGRAGQADAVDSFCNLGHKRASWIGWVGVAVASIIACYYSHVGGWVMRYVVSYATEAQTVFADSKKYLFDFLGYHLSDGSSSFPWLAIVFAAVFMTICCVVLLLGVQNGIEKFNKVGMPALFIILLVLLVRIVTMEGAGEGLKFMFTIDFSHLTFATVLSALGQAFYSLSLGMAIMITYASYLPKTENIHKNTILISSMDTLVALIAGFIIVPAVFATLGNEAVGKGGTYAFVSLAGVFEQMKGGAFFGCLFYLLLLCAALTSCISIIEGVVAFITERFNCGRKMTTVILCVLMFLVGCLYTCSQAAYPIKGIWLDLANGVSFPAFCDAMEFLTDRLMIPVCALGVCIFVGWIWKPQSAIAEMEQSGHKFPYPRVFSFLIRYVAPISIFVILVFSFVTGTSLS